MYLAANSMAELHILAKQYIFGENILDAKFCNAVSDGFVAMTTTLASSEHCDTQGEDIVDREIINIM